MFPPPQILVAVYCHTSMVWGCSFCESRCQLTVHLLPFSPGTHPHRNKTTSPPEHTLRSSPEELAPPGWKRGPEKMASSSSPTHSPSPMQAFTHLPTFKPQANGTPLKLGLQSPQPCSRSHCLSSPPRVASSPTVKHGVLQEAPSHQDGSEMSSPRAMTASHEMSGEGTLGHQVGPVMERPAQRSNSGVSCHSQTPTSCRTVSSAPASPQIASACNGQPHSERTGPELNTLPRCPNSTPSLGLCSFSVQQPALGYGFVDMQCSPTPAFPIATAYYTGAESTFSSRDHLCEPQQPPLPEKHHTLASRNWERSSPPGRSPGSAHHVTFAPGVPDGSTPGPGKHCFRIDIQQGEFCSVSPPFFPLEGFCSLSPQFLAVVLYFSAAALTVLK